VHDGREIRIGPRTSCNLLNDRDDSRSSARESSSARVVGIGDIAKWLVEADCTHVGDQVRGLKVRHCLFYDRERG
jgi:hypothetical protein